MIRKELGLLLSGVYSEKDLNRVVEFFKRYAVGYIRMKRKVGNSFCRIDDIESVAYSSISELFSRDADDRFPNLERYFGSKPVGRLPDHELEPEIRRLIFTKVNDYLYRRLGDYDPSLKKIIRNIKSAFASGDFDRYTEISGNTVYLKSHICEDTLPELPHELLEIYLCSRINRSSMIPEILAAAIEIIDRQELYQKRIGITALALSIRNSFIALQNHHEQEENRTMRTILNGDLEKFIGISKKNVQEKISAKYLKSGKMDRDEMQSYFSAAADILNDQFVDEKQFKDSQFEYLNSYMKNLDYEQFRNLHRKRLEYFVKLVRVEMIDLFKKDLFSNQQSA